MAQPNIISKRIADFSRRPGPRYYVQGPSSGEEFYVKHLKPWFQQALRSNARLEVILDGTDGYLTSFIDEAFGRLVFDFGLQTVQNNLVVVSKLEPEWKSRLSGRTYPAWERRRMNNEAPKHTITL